MCYRSRRFTVFRFIFALILIPIAHASAPVTIENCGVTLSVAAPPARVVTLNQAATEVMLKLGLGDRLAGTAYLDDEILPEVADAYRRVPVLASKYPSREALLAVRPDFLYAAYASAFAANGVGTRAEWKTRGVESYVAPAACADKSRAPGVTLETTFGEIRDVARLFGVAARGEALIASYQAEVQAIRSRIGTVTRPPRVFWYDAGDPPQAGVCCGAPNEILKLVGATNIFADTPGSWTQVSWESVIARNPDVIVLANASWSTAAEKRAQLAAKKALAGIDAIEHGRIVEIDFAYTTPGVRNVAAVRTLAQALYPDKFR